MVEYTVTDATTTDGFCSDICVEDSRLGYSSNNGIYAVKLSGGEFLTSHSYYNVPNIIRIEVTGTTIRYYKDNVLLGTGTDIAQNHLLQLKTYPNRSIQIKNLKIKAL